jgi:hypothetical protein
MAVPAETLGKLNTKNTKLLLTHTYYKVYGGPDTP